MTASFAITLAAASASACARFDDSYSAPFSEIAQPDHNLSAPGPHRPPNIPPPLSSPDSVPGKESEAKTPRQSPPNREECPDPDPAVIATCLLSSSAVVGFPERGEALVAERDSGLVWIVSTSEEPKEYARIDTGGATVAALTLSPSYDQDRLIFAILTSPAESSVVRIAAGDRAKPVATGLPGTASAKAGLVFAESSMLLGIGEEVLRLNRYSGVGSAPPPELVTRTTKPINGLCSDPAVFPGIYVTTGGSGTAELSQLTGTTLSRKWHWPDHTEIGGCTLTPPGPAVALPGAQRVDAFALDPVSGIVTAPPVPLAEGRYGRFSGIALIAGNALLGTTSNRDSSPSDTDDRAVLLPFSASGEDERT